MVGGVAGWAISPVGYVAFHILVTATLAASQSPPPPPSGGYNGFLEQVRCAYQVAFNSFHKSGGPDVFSLDLVPALQ